MSAEPAQSEDEGGDIEPEVPELAPPPAARWAIQTTRLDLSIDYLHRRFRQGLLIIEPDFARHLPWDAPTKSKLVESILLRIPLPAIYLFEELDGKMTVIDGQQRLDTLFAFIENKFLLENPPLLWDLHGKNFLDIERRLQRRVLDAPLTCFVVLPGTDPALKMEIFLRLNLGTSPLITQEIRNRVLHGPGLDLVKRLADDAGPFSFRAVTDRHRALPRRSADELVLRGLAFLDCDPKMYSGRMAEFLSMELTRLNRATPEQIARLERRFRVALERVATVFGDNAFRRYIPSEDRWAVKLSGPLVEVLPAGFDRHFPEEKPLASATAHVILARFKRLCGDPTFVGAITGATQSPGRVAQRFGLWMKELADVA